MKLFLIIVVLFLFVGCTKDTDAYRALSKAGYTNIETDGYAWFACGRDDFYSTKFVATNPIGKKVSGVVCSGFFFKSSTIRF